MEQLVRWKERESRKPLLLKGVRQVGKTFLLREFGKRSFRKTLYLNFEKDENLKEIFEKDLDPKRILTEIAFKFDEEIEIGEDLVIFDEIQEAPKALTSLKYFAEEMPELHICGAGSLLGLHLSSHSFPVGKVTFETLRPMSFKEFLQASNDKGLKYIDGNDFPDTVHDHLITMLKHYFIVGGLPEAVTTYCKYKNDLYKAFTRVRKKQGDLLKSYEANIAKHSGKVNAMHIERVFRSAVAQLCKSTNAKATRFRFRGVVPGISHYDRLAGAIDWLDSVGMIVKVHIANSGEIPFSAHTKENIFKLFLFDIGILGAMAEIPPKTILDAKYGSYKGYFAENFAAQELLTTSIETLYAWQEKLHEIEFLLTQNGKAVPLEIKAGKQTHSTSLKKFIEKYSPENHFILNNAPPNSRSHTFPLYRITRVINQEC